MIDDAGVPVSDLARSKALCTQALAPIGDTLLQTFLAAVSGIGEATKPDFWIVGGTPTPQPVHVALRVGSRALVDAFHQAALAAGDSDNGAPGLRSRYHATWYGAFVPDPDGNNIGAVCHDAA